MIKRILVGIGGTPFTTVAIQRAVELASLHGARLTAVSVVEPERICSLGPVPPGAGIYAKRMCENRLEVTRHQVEEAIDTFEKSCLEAGVEFNVERETGNNFDLMISHSRYHDLTIFGLRSIFEYQLAEEPEKDLIRMLSKGVRPILAVSSRFRPIRKAMIAYSGSMESAKAMRHFVQFKLWPDAVLDIVYFNDGSKGNKTLLEEAAAYCRDHGFTTHTRMIPGQAGKQLFFSARDINADMIVMGNSIRSIWLRKMLGDTVINTLIQADRPLFLSQ
jgi:nucleotide-binding universal stress UspA family protein